MFIRSFSSFTIEDSGGRPVLLGLSPKTIELLCYLLLRSPRPVRREQVIADLYLETECGSPKNALSTLLSRLRTRLRASPLKAGLTVYATKDCIGAMLDQSCSMDALILDRAVDSLRRNGGADATGAVSVYEEPFLNGHDSEWILCERSRLRAGYVELMRHQVSRAIEAGDLRLASIFCEEILRVDNFEKFAHLGLIAGLAGSGQRVLAIARFRDYQSMMRTEMFMDVLPEAKKLAQIVTSGDCSRSAALSYFSDHLI